MKTVREIYLKLLDTCAHNPPPAHVPAWDCAECAETIIADAMQQARKDASAAAIDALRATADKYREREKELGENHCYQEAWVSCERACAMREATTIVAQAIGADIRALGKGDE